MSNLKFFDLDETATSRDLDNASETYARLIMSLILSAQSVKCGHVMSCVHRFLQVSKTCQEDAPGQEWWHRGSKAKAFGLGGCRRIRRFDHFVSCLLLSALRPPPYHFDEMLAVPWSRFQAMKERYEALKKKLAEDKAQSCQIQRDLQ